MVSDTWSQQQEMQRFCVVGVAESKAPGLYLHVPFCSSICPYCDFAVVKDGAASRRSYLSSLEAELEYWKTRLAPDADFDTVYLGGGTPSLLSSEELGRVQAWIRRSVPLAEQARWSLEANPEDVDEETVGSWLDAGIDFLSLGVQSLSVRGLKHLGRRHSVEQARRAIQIAAAAGFKTVSVDLMYCLADQTEQEWIDELQAVVDLGPDHLSCYELTFHEQTPFGRALERGTMRSMEEDSRAGLFELTHRQLSALGFEGYEVSNFARPGARSRHNQKYWHHAPYLGIGPSAHSFDGRRRWWNWREPSEWGRAIESGGSPIAGSERLGREELELEALMFALRKLEGTSMAELERDYGFDRKVLAARALPLVKEGLIDGIVSAADKGFLRGTLEGRAVAESLAVWLS